MLNNSAINLATVVQTLDRALVQINPSPEDPFASTLYEVNQLLYKLHRELSSGYNQGQK